MNRPVKSNVATLIVLAAALVLGTVVSSPRSAAAAEQAADLATASSAEAKALAAYDQGDFATAQAAYEALIAAGVVNGHLYYNLGIVYFRRGQVGDAVAALLAARRLLPRDPDVAANLRFVLDGVKDGLEPELPATWAKRLTFWADRDTTKELAWAAAWTAALLGLALCAALLIPALARRRVAGVVVWGLVVPLTLAAAAVFHDQVTESWGAVRAKTAKVYSAPGAKSTVLFELREGAPVAVGGGAPAGYLQVTVSDGKRGWIDGSELRVF